MSNVFSPYRTAFRFVEEFFQLSLQMDIYDGENMDVVTAPELREGERKLVLVTHDETCFESNDAKRSVWLEGENSALRPKGSGKSLMVSQFLCQCHGNMEVLMTDELVDEYPSLNFVAGKIAETVRIIRPGKNADGYWGNGDLVNQLKVTIALFEILHPDCEAVFAFDNSANHHAFAPDALRASRLNLSDGGKNTPLLRKGWFECNGRVIAHEMQYPVSAGHSDPLQKGIKTILQERSLWPSNRVLSLSDARLLLSQQDDFRSQREWLEETVVTRGHRIIFYPKFHPEFNWIEMFWGATKRYTRKHCTYSFQDLERVVPQALKVTSVATMRRFARKCLRYINIYRSEVQLTPKQIEYAMKKYSSHRCIPTSILNSL